MKPSKGKINSPLFKCNFHEINCSPADKVIDNIRDGVVNVGLAGLYLTADRLTVGDLSYPHSYDCAAFISLTSTALPRLFMPRY